MTPAVTGFRPDIQILRGVAVLAVLAYHLRPGMAPSGFLGVDLFFVVSGYLMATLYGDLTASGVLAFFRKRAARLIPAYAVTIAATLIAATFIFYPQELETARRGALYAAGLIPNVGFWLHDTYFSPDLVRPLLHLWTIGVEIQFYLVFPLMLWLWRRSRTAVIVLVLLNLAACLVMTEVSSRTSFYLTPFRMWEFAFGFLAAKALSGRAWGEVRPAAGWVGVAALGAACVLMAVGGLSTHHPGWAALAACTLAAVILACGLPAALSSSLPGRMLIKVGDYSYALYLAHFPVIALGFYQPFLGWKGASGDWQAWLLVLVLIPALTVALHRLIERPMRRWLTLGAAGAVLAGLMVFVIAAGPVTRAVEDVRFTPVERLVLAAWDDRAPIRCGSLGVIPPLHESCELTAPTAGGHRILLVGDSHAESLAPTLAVLARQAGDGVRLNARSCVIGRPDCRPADIVETARTAKADVILLSGLATRFDPEAVEALLIQARAQGIQVVMVDPHPTVPFDVIAALHAEVRRGEAPPTLTLAGYETQNAEVLAVLDRLEARGLVRVPVVPALCPDVCPLTDGQGRPLYSDRQHLSQTGIRRLIPALERFLEDLDAPSARPAATPQPLAPE